MSLSKRNLSKQAKMKWDYGCEGCLKADKHVFAVPSVMIPAEAEI